MSCLLPFAPSVTTSDPDNSCNYTASACDKGSETECGTGAVLASNFEELHFDALGHSELTMSQTSPWAMSRPMRAPREAQSTCVLSGGSQKPQHEQQRSQQYTLNSPSLPNPSLNLDGSQSSDKKTANTPDDLYGRPRIDLPEHDVYLQQQQQQQIDAGMAMLLCASAQQYSVAFYDSMASCTEPAVWHSRSNVFEVGMPLPPSKLGSDIMRPSATSPLICATSIWAPSPVHNPKSSMSAATLPYQPLHIRDVPTKKPPPLIVSSADRRHACGFMTCEKRFKRLAHLQRHHHSHTQKRPFKCPFSDCQRSFGRTDNLRQHLKTHLAYDKDRDTGSLGGPCKQSEKC